MLPAKAQTEIVPTKHFDGYNGLPAKVVYNLCKDGYGFIWIASENGVYRFDGKTFFPYTVVNGLADDETIEIFADSDNDIWCTGYNRGLTVIRNGVVDTGDPIVAAWSGKHLLHDVVQDRDGFLYMLGQGGKLYRADKKRQTVELFCESFELRNLTIYNDTLWSLGYMRMLYFNKAKRQFEEADRFAPIAYMEQADIFPSRTDGSFWRMWKNGMLENMFTGRRLDFGALAPCRLTYVQAIDGRFVLTHFMDRGTFLYDLYSDTYQKIRLPDDCRVVDAVKDNQGNIWLSGYNSGIYRINPFQDERASWPGFGRSVVQVQKKAGELLVLTANGEFITWKNGKTNPLNLNAHLKGKLTGFQYSDFVDWGNQGVIAINTTALVSVKGNKVFSLGEGAGGKQLFWVGDSLLAFNSGGSMVLRPANLTPIEGRIYNYRLDYKIYGGRVFISIFWQNRIWLATHEGIRQYNIQTRRLEDHTYAVPQGVRIEDMVPWRHNILLLCTSNKGLALFKGGRIITRLDISNGLLDNHCNEIDSCSRGWLVRHPKGLSLVDLYTGKIATVNQWQGIPVAEVNRIRVFDDTAYLCTKKGLLPVDIQALFTRRNDTRQVQFFRMLVDGQPVFPKDLALSYGVEKIKIDFALAEYGQPYAVEYQWQINGTGWNSSEGASLDFVNLPSGTYGLQVRARAPGYGWTEISELAFRIATPFWQTWWFAGSLGLLLLLLGWGIQRRLYLRRLATEREKASVRYQLMDFEQKALNAMMNPHFVFNAMGSIQHLLTQGDNRQANDYLVKFSRLIRKSLETSQLEFCYLDDEIERLTLYLQLEKMRFGGRMDFSIEVSGDLDAEQVKIPTMILQTYVENAVIHGVAAVRHNASIHIRFSETKDGICVHIEDNGPGFDTGDRKKRSVRFGVSATEKRLELLTQITGRPYSVNTVSPVGPLGGTRIELLFSLQA